MKYDNTKNEQKHLIYYDAGNNLSFTECVCVYFLFVSMKEN